MRRRPPVELRRLRLAPSAGLLFDLNDFDETLPGPFEYDVKRMAASFTIAARNNGFATADTRGDAGIGARLPGGDGFLRQMPTMDIWYAHLAEDELTASIRSTVAGTARQEKVDKHKKTPKKAERAAKKEEEEEQAAKTAQKRAAKTLGKAQTRDSLQALSKLGEVVDGNYRIVSQPPVVVPARDLAATYGLSADEVRATRSASSSALPGHPARRPASPAGALPVVDLARKVVGVGSVGTRAFIVLLQGRDAQDPLFLQIKEATASVLEPHVRKSRYRQHGERVAAISSSTAGIAECALHLLRSFPRDPRWRQSSRSRHLSGYHHT